LFASVDDFIVIVFVTTTIFTHSFTTYSIVYSANPSQSKQQPPSCSNPIGRVIQTKTGYSCDLFPVLYADSQGCFEYSANPHFHQMFSFTAPVNGTATCTSPPTSAASVQIVNYASPSVCVGPITGATIISTGVCLQFSLTSGNSSIVTKTGNVVSAQGYADSSCQAALGPSESIPLNTCTIKGGNALIAYAYAPNTLPPAPFTSTTGQVTETFA
jgi:hypothetical protein